MTRACQRGWQKYLDDPQPANDLIRQANPEMSAEALAYGATALKPLCLPDDAAPETLGHMTLERWQKLSEQLVEIELLAPGKVQPQDAFTTQFLAP